MDAAALAVETSLSEVSTAIIAAATFINSVSCSVILPLTISPTIWACFKTASRCTPKFSIARVSAICVKEPLTSSSKEISFSSERTNTSS